ncbi:hypothetical protein AF332_27600 [Sporosarcina globispora]|uniref:Uncharacterized protein n=1 Tax=Sporosarcina globispora TaxID=1459 RepID=A0A0M0G171_SPOGL|nr:hypothetical protein [Sporosarcina globispora]KON83518.1 hypothetical protein AF332_27600 [Sporosarcina globispora]
MLVKNTIRQIESKEIAVQNIADHYNVTKRTIQSRFKNLCYKWNSKASKYDYIGDTTEPLETDFNDLFESNTKANRNSLESEIASTSEQLDDEAKALDGMKQEEMDAVDILLKGYRLVGPLDKVFEHQCIIHTRKHNPPDSFQIYPLVIPLV